MTLLQNAKLLKIVFSTSTFMIKKKNYMHVYVVRETLYENCKIHGFLVTGSGPSVQLKRSYYYTIITEY